MKLEDYLVPAVNALATFPLEREAEVHGEVCDIGRELVHCRRNYHGLGRQIALSVEQDGDVDDELLSAFATAGAHLQALKRRLRLLEVLRQDIRERRRLTVKEVRDTI